MASTARDLHSLRDELVFVDPADFFAHHTAPVAPVAPPQPDPLGDPQAVALALATFGAPVPQAVFSGGVPYTLPGWMLGSAQADSLDASGVHNWVRVEILLVDPGRYAIREHRASSEEEEGIILTEANGTLFASMAELRAHCMDCPGDTLTDAARCAALDDAMRRWAPLRRAPVRAAG